ncbi:adenylosuccinate synthetase [Actinorhabdospora filicis]|uniref:Adenylosuccinate synthetase n=1 Tax=Actinorhabdospora filicis TaxID=1785913 RepID=A0A9W6SJQ0_9ACTN|nr:adenylosuccinate synthetase [Actinorhabdospora filicis]GLZ77057.1 adenylosuccinate synthetase [Actinorhabdospora filicis]
MTATVIVDALWGDSGKGKACAHLARRDGAALTVRAGMGTNAGASVTLDDGVLVKQRQLPTGWINPGTSVAVGPGVMVDPRVFLDEVERFGLRGRAFVDGRCGVITADHAAAERDDANLMAVVGSTASGTGRARADFVLRRASQVKDVAELAEYTVDVPRLVNDAARDGGVIVEGSQGTMLSLAFSPDYPYTTSGNCTTAAAIDDAGLNWRLVTDVVMVVKAMPTRVGGGPLPFEMSGEEAVARGIAEYGVNTGRQRRKASKVDPELLAYAAMLNGPTQIALTFTDHLDPAMKSRRTGDALTPEVRRVIAEVEEATGAPVTMLDTGPGVSDVVDLA